MKSVKFDMITDYSRVRLVGWLGFTGIFSTNWPYHSTYPEGKTFRDSAPSEPRAPLSTVGQILPVPYA